MTKTGIDEVAWKDAVEIGADEFTDPSDYEGVCIHFSNYKPSYCEVSGCGRTPSEGKSMSECEGYLEGCRMFRV
jgi:hypothetical protein